MAIRWHKGRSRARDGLQEAPIARAESWIDCRR